MTALPCYCTTCAAPMDDIGGWDGSGRCRRCVDGHADVVRAVFGEAAPPPDKAEALLREALTIVTGARRQAYGTPENNFGCIADLWNIFLRRRQITHADMAAEVTPGDVAVMMVLMKAARLAESPDHHDSAVDIAGYAACLARCQKDAP